ncbi:MAG: twin-arginine translocase TatA/TatE family subunit [Rhodospirillales bacterium]|jgi:sec-independent protein translocase protein TatA
MGAFSIWHWLIVLAIVLLLFGRGRIPQLFGDFGKGLKAFKKNIKEEDEDLPEAKVKALSGEIVTDSDSSAEKKQSKETVG